LFSCSKFKNNVFGKSKDPILEQGVPWGSLSYGLQTRQTGDPQELLAQVFLSLKSTSTTFYGYCQTFLWPKCIARAEIRTVV
jgi:hypothetical protein